MTTGDDTTPAPAPAATEAKQTALTADKPYVIYVADPAGTTGFDTVEKVILDDDRVKLGALPRRQDAPGRREGGSAAPRRMAARKCRASSSLTADLKTVKKLEGAQLKLGEVWGSMKATADKFYEQDLDSTVRELKSVLIEFDKINKERARDRPNNEEKRQAPTRA